MTTCTERSCFVNLLAISAALYAAIEAVTPRMMFMGAVGRLESGALIRATFGPVPSTIRSRHASTQNPNLSFYILDLFADLFQLGFALDNNLGNLGVVCFGAECIQLAAQFLADELKRTPDGVLLVGCLEE